MALGVVVHLDHRCQCAATQAADSFERGHTGRVGVFARRDAEQTAQLCQQPIRPRYVAGRAAADLNDVFAARSGTELGIERGDPGDLFGGDVGQLVKTLEGGWRQEVVVFVNGVQQGDQIVLLAADSLDQGVDRRQINRHRCLLVGSVRREGAFGLTAHFGTSSDKRAWYGGLRRRPRLDRHDEDACCDQSGDAGKSLPAAAGQRTRRLAFNLGLQPLVGGRVLPSGVLSLE